MYGNIKTISITNGGLIDDVEGRIFQEINL